jgi:peptidoglycan/xylan/chitin deacetylase (PgdA/CDA1 family)
MKKTVLAAIVWGILVIALGGGVAEAKPKIAVVIRFDDYTAGSATDNELRIFMAFYKRHIPLTVAVIPFCGSFPTAPDQVDPPGLTEGKAWVLKMLVDQGGFEVADHGYSHENAAKGSPSGDSEFQSRPYEEQYQRMTRGKQLLEKLTGVPILTFVPPWNTYDENTVHAAQACGFRSFAPGGPDDPMQKKYGLPFIGCGQWLGGLKQGVEDARKSPLKHPIVTGLFHVYEIKDFNQQNGLFTFAELEQILDWLKAQSDVRLVTISKAAKLVKIQ